MQTTMSWEEFLNAGEEWQAWEYVDGKVEFMSPHMRKGHIVAVKAIAKAANDFELRRTIRGG